MNNSKENITKNLFRVVDNYFNISFIFLLIYISFLNIFVFKTSPELLFIQFGIFIIAFKTTRIYDFLKVWVVFISLFFLYEFLRGFADNYSPFYEDTLYFIYNLELYIFRTLPTSMLQMVIPEDSLLNQISILFYSSFFYYSFFAGFIIWIKNGSVFGKYYKGFLLLSFVALLLFFLIPTAPPWMANIEYDLGLKRRVFDNALMQNFQYASIWSYYLYGNPVAAFPSLHTAWPAYTSIFIILTTSRRLYYLLLIIPIMIGFSVILTAEHYIIDVIAGFIMAYIAVRYSLLYFK